MPLTTAVVFLCSKCKKEYFWQPELARKVAQCPCGEVIQFPADDPSHAVNSPVMPYLPSVIDEGEAMRRARAAMKDDGGAAVTRDMFTAAMESDEPVAPLDPYRDVNVPLAVLAAGLLVMGTALAEMADKQGWFKSVLLVGGTTAVELLLVLLGLTLAGNMAAIDFGPKKTASFKLTALFLAPNSVLLIMPMLMGDDGVSKVVGSFTSLILFWVLFAYLFRLSGWRVIVCIGTIIAVKAAAQILQLWLLTGVMMMGH